MKTIILNVEDLKDRAQKLRCIRGQYEDCQAKLNSCMNHLYDEIVLCESNDWEYYKNKYKPFYNSIKTEFRLCAPKV